MSTCETVAELIRDAYPELRRIAGCLLRNERKNHTLQPTALVNEAFIKLFGPTLDDPEGPAMRLFASTNNQSKADFLAFAAKQMRRILIDYGRKHGATKRGGGLARVPLLDLDHFDARDFDSLLALDQALDKLEKIDKRGGSVVELKFFGGFTNDETAEILGVSDATVEADWTYARLWLLRKFTEERTVTRARRPETSVSETSQQA